MSTQTQGEREVVGEGTSTDGSNQGTNTGTTVTNAGTVGNNQGTNTGTSTGGNNQPIQVQQGIADLPDRWTKQLKENRGWLMLGTSFVASLAFQAVVNPPGGFWQDDKDGPGGHTAGTPVMSDKYRSFQIFKALNIIAFLTAVIIILLLSNDRFHRTQNNVIGLTMISLFYMACEVCVFIIGSSLSAPAGGFLFIPITMFICVFFFRVVPVMKEIYKLLKHLWTACWTRSGDATENV